MGFEFLRRPLELDRSVVLERSDPAEHLVVEILVPAKEDHQWSHLPRLRSHTEPDADPVAFQLRHLLEFVEDLVSGDPSHVDCADQLCRCHANTLSFNCRPSLIFQVAIHPFRKRAIEGAPSTRNVAVQFLHSRTSPPSCSTSLM